MTACSTCKRCLLTTFVRVVESPFLQPQHRFRYHDVFRRRRPLCSSLRTRSSNSFIDVHTDIHHVLSDHDAGSVPPSSKPDFALKRPGKQVEQNLQKRKDGAEQAYEVTKTHVAFDEWTSGSEQAKMEGLPNSNKFPLGCWQKIYKGRKVNLRRNTVRGATAGMPSSTGSAGSPTRRLTRANRTEREDPSSRTESTLKARSHLPPVLRTKDYPTSPREQWQIQKKALKSKFPNGWQPRKRLSPDALDGIRALHTQDPYKYDTPSLAEQFELSPEAIRRILRSKWRPSDQEQEQRKQRWEKRGQTIWSEMAQKGIKPPKRWRDTQHSPPGNDVLVSGVFRDPHAPASMEPGYISLADRI